MKRFLVLTVAAMLSIGASATAFAVELPQTMVRDGRVFTIDKNAGGGPNTATPDFNMRSVTRNADYKVLGSDVALYVDYSNGQGGDHFAAGWVRATAPKFTARAEIWANGKLDTTGPNKKMLAILQKQLLIWLLVLLRMQFPEFFITGKI